jgi:hypothetical protein
MTVDEFNALPAQEARDALALCCVSERWIDRCWRVALTTAATRC